MTILVITHYTRILKYLKPDTVIVMKDGNIVATGTSDLANSIEKADMKKSHEKTPPAPDVDLTYRYGFSMDESRSSKQKKASMLTL